MADEEQLRILKQGVDAWNAWRQQAGNIRINLREAILIEAELHGADLHGADLCGANLGRANLRTAALDGANLNRANLIEADLRGDANLTEANLTEGRRRLTDVMSTRRGVLIDERRQRTGERRSGGGDRSLDRAELGDLLGDNVLVKLLGAHVAFRR
jgi:uncharacterized protein YjbI with pentapeptide repeats